MMNDDGINRTPLSRDEFLLATSVATPSPEEKWTEAVSALLLTISMNDGTLTGDDMIYVIQQLALKMPPENLISGVLRIVTLSAAIQQGIDPRTL